MTQINPAGVTWYKSCFPGSKKKLYVLIDYGCHAGLQNYNEQVTRPAWPQHAVGLEPSPNVRYYISPLLTDSSMG